MIKNINPGYVPVRCTTCDPPSVVYVPAGTVINQPYVCTACQQRVLKRIKRNSEARVGRMGHGSVRAQEKR